MARTLHEFRVTDYHKNVCVFVCVYVPSTNKKRMGTIAIKAQALKASARK